MTSALHLVGIGRANRDSKLMPAVGMSATRAKIVVVGTSRGLCDAKLARWKQDDSSHRERFNEHGANMTRDLVAVASQFQTMGKGGREFAHHLYVGWCSAPMHVLVTTEDMSHEGHCAGG